MPRQVLAAQSLVLIPIVVYAIAPTRSSKTFETARLWLEEHNRLIMSAVSLIFGLFFLFKGITGLGRMTSANSLSEGVQTSWDPLSIWLSSFPATSSR